MQKKLIALLALIMCICACMAFVACGGDNGGGGESSDSGNSSGGNDECTHTYSDSWTYDSTNHWHAATCEHTDEKSDLAAHEWNSGVVTTELTCTTDGVTTYTCTVCGATKITSIKSSGHTYSDSWTYDSTNHWHAATCGHADAKSDLAAHEWNSGVVTTEPQEDSTGVKTYTCTVCGETKTEILAATGTLGQQAMALLRTITNRPDPWSFMPEALRDESMAYSALPTTYTTDTDATPLSDNDFVSKYVTVSTIGTRSIGKQMHVLYEGLDDIETALGYFDNFTTVLSALTTAYQTFINDNPSDFTKFETSIGGFKICLALQNDAMVLLAGNSIVSIELGLDSSNTYGRIQITDGIAVKYIAGENYFKFAVKAVYSGVGNLKQIEFLRSDDAVTGYLYEYVGSEDTNIKTRALITINSDYTRIVSDKRETDDLIIDGYEEVYSSTTGNFIGGEVAETVEKADYDTVWIPLTSVSGITSIKVNPESNGVNADTIYINGKTTAIKTKLVGGLSLKMASRRFDIEMKDVWYVIKSTDEDGEVSYQLEKTSIPMLFVQKDYLSSLTSDYEDKNDVTITVSSTVKSTITQNFSTLLSAFETIKESVPFSEIISYIGTANAYFTTTDTTDE